MKGFGIQRGLVILVAVLSVHTAYSQYIPASTMKRPEKITAGYWHPGNAFEHLDLSLSVGTSGIGIDIAMPICEFAQVRAGYEFMPHFKKSISAELMVGNEKSLQYDENRNRIETNYTHVSDLIYKQFGYDMQPYIDMTSRLTMNNFKFLVDIFPLSGNKKLHFTVGFYIGSSQFAKIEHNSGSTSTLMGVSAYNKMYDSAPETDILKSYGRAGFPMGVYAADVRSADGTQVLIKSGEAYKMTPGDKGAIDISVKTNAFKPYLGVGYEANLLKKRDDFKFAITGGLMFWGGTPSIVTPDGVNLADDVNDIPGDMGDYVIFITKLKAFPNISVRIIKNIF